MIDPTIFVPELTRTLPRALDRLSQRFRLVQQPLQGRDQRDKDGQQSAVHRDREELVDFSEDRLGSVFRPTPKGTQAGVRRSRGLTTVGVREIAVALHRTTKAFISQVRLFTATPKS